MRPDTDCRTTAPRVQTAELHTSRRSREGVFPAGPRTGDPPAGSGSRCTERSARDTARPTGIGGCGGLRAGAVGSLVLLEPNGEVLGPVPPKKVQTNPTNAVTTLTNFTQRLRTRFVARGNSGNTLNSLTTPKRVPFAEFCCCHQLGLQDATTPVQKLTTA